MRRGGKPLSECQGVGYGNMPYANQRPERSGQAPQFARAGLIIIKVVSIYSRHEEQFDLLS